MCQYQNICASKKYIVSKRIFVIFQFKMSFVENYHFAPVPVSYPGYTYPVHIWELDEGVLERVCTGVMRAIGTFTV